MKQSPTLGTYVQHKQHERDELQRHLDEFHKRGGKTQILQPGEVSGQPTEFTARQKVRRAPK